MIVGRAKGSVFVEGEPPQYFVQYLSTEEIDMPSDRLARLIGDGHAARVSASMELKDSDFGTGFGAYVTVTLACHQEESTVEEAIEVASDLAGEYVKDAYDIAHAAFKKKVKPEDGKSRRGRR